MSNLIPKDYYKDYYSSISVHQRASIMRQFGVTTAEFSKASLS